MVQRGRRQSLRRGGEGRAREHAGEELRERELLLERERPGRPNREEDLPGDLVGLTCKILCMY